MSFPLTSRLKKVWASIALLSIELVIIIVLFIISILGFVFLVNRIFRLEKDEFDFRIFGFLNNYINEVNTGVMVFITFFATHTFLIPANLVLIAYFLFIKRHRWYSIKVPVVAIGSVCMMLLLKLFFSRPRPLTPLLQEVKGFSFPSGHSMSAMTFYGLIIYLVYKNVTLPWLRWTLILVLSLFIVAIGFSRIYLRVHYTSDVLAGFAIGLIWLVISISVMAGIEKFTRKKIAPIITDEPKQQTISE